MKKRSVFTISTPMDRKRYASMALMAGLGILLAAVVFIATKRRPESPEEHSSMDAVHLATDLIRMRIDGADSGSKRRALKAAARKLPDSALSRAMIAFGDENLEAGVKEFPENPFATGLRGWMLVELGRKTDGAREIDQALAEAPPEWELRPLFEAALKKAR
jgi:hypothetical protein